MPCVDKWGAAEVLLGDRARVIEPGDKPMSSPVETKPFVDPLTLAGLVLLLLPLLIMAHELGGHATACLALGGELAEIGAYYVKCNSQTDLARRVVSMAGTGTDVLIFAAGYALWRRAKTDLLRLAFWIVFVGKGMAAMGYFMFSGVSGVGDWGPGQGGGIGPLPYPLLVRALLFGLGLFFYFKVIGFGRETMRQMVGGNPDGRSARRTITLGYYWVTGLAALAIGLLNPVGIFVVIASAVASSFGGNAGIFSIAHDRIEGPALSFNVARNWWVIVAGLIAIATFAAILGPSIVFK
jgi:hypothetical protein